MYLACVDGKESDGKTNAIALGRCLSALDVWGGQLTPTRNNLDSKKLLHPVHVVAAQWRHEDLTVILSHCNCHYPLTDANGEDVGAISLSALFDYFAAVWRLTLSPVLSICPGHYIYFWNGEICLIC